MKKFVTANTWSSNLTLWAIDSEGTLNKANRINRTHMWEEMDNSLYRKFSFEDFSEAFSFMTKVALAAEKMDHHPKWTNVWNTVEIWLSTHSAGNKVTEKDRELARKIDAFL